jgi:hypothetical protein
VDVQVVGHADAVGDNGEPGNLSEVHGRRVRRRARANRDRAARFNQRCRHGADPVLGGQLTVRLRLEARLVTRAPRRARRTAVYLLDQAPAGERVDVPAHRHLGNAEQLCQLGDPGAADPLNLREYPFLSLSWQHGGTIGLLVRHDQPFVDPRVRPAMN